MNFHVYSFYFSSILLLLPSTFSASDEPANWTRYRFTASKSRLIEAHAHRSIVTGSAFDRSSKKKPVPSSELNVIAKGMLAVVARKSSQNFGLA